MISFFRLGENLIFLFCLVAMICVLTPCVCPNRKKLGKIVSQQSFLDRFSERFLFKVDLSARVFYGVFFSVSFADPWMDVFRCPCVRGCRMSFIVVSLKRKLDFFFKKLRKKNLSVFTEFDSDLIDFHLISVYFILS